MARDIALGNPAVFPEEDEFNRAPFSRALADRIADLGNNQGAAVVGLYGRWGYGKSTVLNFLKFYLNEHHKNEVTVIDFNPWLFTEQKELLQSFFEMISAALNIEADKVQDAARLLEKYSGVLGLIPGFGGGASKLAEQIGKNSQISLEAQHDIIAQVSRDRPTIVVLIDDLDRLDRSEVMLMLKLVRLNASLPRLVYVLAFDDDIISNVAGSAYSFGKDGGRQFLEKIVQFPFSIPAVGHERLIDYVVRHAKNACNRAGISLNERDWREFFQINDEHFSLRLTTPRQAIRYGAALDFAMPMLKDEVDPLQQMVIEGIRILFPELYEFIRDHVGQYTQTTSQAQLVAAIDHLMGTPESADKSTVYFLADYLRKSSRNDVMIRQPLGNTRYFNRYFEYSLRPGEISDKDWDSFLSVVYENDDADIAKRLSELAAKNANGLLDLIDTAIVYNKDFFSVNEARPTKLTYALAEEGASFAVGIPYHKDIVARRWANILARLALKVSMAKGEQTAHLISVQMRDEDFIQLLSRIRPIPLLPVFLANLSDLNREVDLSEKISATLFDNAWTHICDIIKKNSNVYFPQLFDEGTDGFFLFETWRTHDYLSFSAWFEERTKATPLLAVNLIEFLNRKYGPSMLFFAMGDSAGLYKWIELEKLLQALKVYYEKPCNNIDSSTTDQILFLYHTYGKHRD